MVKDNIYRSLKLKAFDAMEKVVDLCAIVNSTIAIICKALHDEMLLFVQGNIFSFGQNRPVKQQKTSVTHGSLKGNIELKKYFNEEYDSILMG